MDPARPRPCGTKRTYIFGLELTPHFRCAPRILDKRGGAGLPQRCSRTGRALVGSGSQGKKWTDPKVISKGRRAIWVRMISRLTWLGRTGRLGRRFHRGTQYKTGSNLTLNRKGGLVQKPKDLTKTQRSCTQKKDRHFRGVPCGLDRGRAGLGHSGEGSSIDRVPSTFLGGGSSR